MWLLERLPINIKNAFEPFVDMDAMMLTIKPIQKYLTYATASVPAENIKMDRGGGIKDNVANLPWRG
jgi:hypothetical protein